LKAGAPLDVDVDVKNASSTDGDEVVELYFNFPKLAGDPIRALRGFTRVHLAGGAKQHLHFTLSPRELSLVNDTGDRLVAAGEYRISVGGGQPGTSAAGAETRLLIRGEQKLPE
jgi:beta-glucosidase